MSMFVFHISSLFQLMSIVFFYIISLYQLMSIVFFYIRLLLNPLSFCSLDISFSKKWCHFTFFSPCSTCLYNMPKCKIKISRQINNQISQATISPITKHICINPPTNYIIHQQAILVLMPTNSNYPQHNQY